MKLGEAMYKSQQGQEAPPGAGDAGQGRPGQGDGAGQAGSDQVVDADFEEVRDEDKKAS
jgi:molecular chaperone DnaK